jgi:hypothetical protein
MGITAEASFPHEQMKELSDLFKLVQSSWSLFRKANQYPFHRSSTSSIVKPNLIDVREQKGNEP